MKHSTVMYCIIKMDDIKRIFRLDSELEKAKTFSKVMFGLKDQNDITRTTFSGSLIMGDDIIPLEFTCGESFPKKAPQVKFSEYAYKNYNAVRKLCDDETRMMRSNCDIMCEWRESQSIGKFLEQIQSYINNYS
jgi:ubiquitin-protein ligase